MSFVNTKGILYLPGDLIFEGVIEDGHLKEGTLEGRFTSFKFEGIWDEFLIEKPTHLDEPDFDYYDAMIGTIYRGEYKYVGSFVPDNFYNGDIVSFDKVKVYNKDDELLKEEYINESDEEITYIDSSSYSSVHEPTDYTKFGYRDVLDAHNDKYANMW